MYRYITEKLKILSELGINATRETFAGCRSEIQVDNRAKSLIINGR